MSPNARGYLFAFVAIGALAIVVWFTTRKKPSTASPAKDSGHVVLAPDACKLLADGYDKALDGMRSCTTDADCVAEQRGGFYGDLDGCVRVSNRSPKKDLDAIANEWLAGGCAHDYPSCGAVPPAACRAGACRETPPYPIPDTWQRVGVRSFFTMFIPSDMKQERLENDETYGFLWKGGGRALRIVVIFGVRPGPRESFEKVLSSTPAAIDGRATKVERVRVFDTLRVEATVDAIALPWYAMPFEKVTVNPLTVQLDCDHDELCDIAMTLLSTIEILSEPIEVDR